MHIAPATSPLSFRIAEAYGQIAAARRSESAAQRGQRAGDAERALPDAAQRLVAGVVPGGVDFRTGGAAAASASGTLAFYRNPIAKNEAAVAVAVGRSLDVQA